MGHEQRMFKQEKSGFYAVLYVVSQVYALHRTLRSKLSPKSNIRHDKDSCRSDVSSET